MLRSYTEIQPGSIVIPQQGGVAIFVFDYVHDQDGNKIELLGYPVLPKDQVISGNQDVPINNNYIIEGRIQDIDFHDPVVMVGPRSMRKISIDEDKFFAKFLISTSENFQQLINNTRLEIAPNVSISDIPAAEKARIFDYDQIANVSQPRETAPTEKKEKGKRNTSKALSFSYVPDMYVTDAAEVGLISADAAKAFVSLEILTLQEAWVYAKENDKIAPQSTTVTLFDEAFSNAFSLTEDDENYDQLQKELEKKFSNHPVIKFTEKNKVTLDKIHKLGWISDKTFEIFTQQPTGSKQGALSLEDAFKVLATNANSLENYKRPNSHLDITYGMQLKAQAEIIVIFDLMAKAMNGDEVDISGILKNRSKFLTEFATKGDSRVFQRHQPDREVEKSLEKDLKEHKQKINNGFTPR